MDELELMRQQLKEMKRRLDTQQIVNNELLRKLMCRRASWLNKFVILEILFLPLTYLVFAAISAGNGVSQWYALVYLILGAIDTLVDFRTVRIPSQLFSNASIIQLRKFLIRQKKERFIQTIISTPLVIIWLIAFGIAISAKINISEPCHDVCDAAKIGGIIGGIVGTIIGTAVVIILYKKMQRTQDSLLSDISDLEADE